MKKFLFLAGSRRANDERTELSVRAEALKYVSFAVDDSGTERTGDRIPQRARLVGWQCGFEPLIVAVWSDLPDVRLDECDAEDLAQELLNDRGWFGEDGPRPADFVI